MFNLFDIVDILHVLAMPVGSVFQAEVLIDEVAFGAGRWICLDVEGLAPIFGEDAFVGAQFDDSRLGIGGHVAHVQLLKPKPEVTPNQSTYFRLQSLPHASVPPHARHSCSP